MKLSRKLMWLSSVNFSSVSFVNSVTRLRVKYNTCNEKKNKINKLTLLFCIYHFIVFYFFDSAVCELNQVSQFKH